MIAGADLVTLLLSEHAEHASSSSAPAFGGAAGASGATGSAPATGSIRESVLADCLRADKVLNVLDRVATKMGVKHVQGVMLSGCPLLLRTMLWQESSLLAKAPLSSFGFSAPYITQFVANTLCEDELSGQVPEMLRQYVWPDAEFATCKSGKWSLLELLSEQLKIEELRTGAKFKPVAKKDRYTVDACLRYSRVFGSRLFISLGLSAAPDEGHTFAEMVDKQLLAVSFAHTLPPTCF